MKRKIFAWFMTGAMTASLVSPAFAEDIRVVEENISQISEKETPAVENTDIISADESAENLPEVYPDENYLDVSADAGIDASASENEDLPILQDEGEMEFSAEPETGIEEESLGVEDSIIIEADEEIDTISEAFTALDNTEIMIAETGERTYGLSLDGFPQSEDLLLDYMDSSLDNDGISMLSASYYNGQSLTDYIYNSLYQRLDDICKGNTADDVISTEFDITFPQGSFTGTVDQLNADMQAIGVGLVGQTVTSIFEDTGTGEVKFSPAAIEAYDLILNHAMNEALYRILANCPYELFWYDNIVRAMSVDPIMLVVDATSGLGDNYDHFEAKPFTVKLTVASPYKAEDTYPCYSIDKSKIARVNAAISNVDKYIEASPKNSIYAELLYYGKKICELTDYDYDAAAANLATDQDTSAMTDSWQIVNVFDEDPATKSVCDGYSKAFQYLCQKSDTLSLSGISCVSVDGVLHYADEANEDIKNKNNKHMWNVVTIDGSNYIVDLTQCDQGSFCDLFFLAGAACKAGTDQNPIDSYLLSLPCEKDLRYSYSLNTRNIYNNNPPQISTSYYEGCSHRKASSEMVTWTGKGGTADVKVTIKCASCGIDYDSGDMDMDMYKNVPADVSESAKHVPTCTSNGAYIYTASLYGSKIISSTTVDVIKALGHKWTSKTINATGTKAGYTTYTCSNCKLSEIAYIPVQPAVSLSNTAKGITVTWKKADGAKSYTVYRYDSSSRKWAALKKYTGNSTLTHTDTTAAVNKTYYYTVRAYNENSKHPKYSTFAKGIKYRRLSNISISKATNTATGTANIYWNQNKSATGYQIRYTTGSTSKTITTSGKLVKKGSTSLTRAITKLTKGKTYKFQIRSYTTVTSNSKKTTYFSAWSPAKTLKISK